MNIDEYVGMVSVCMCKGF